MSDEEMKAELDRLRNENAALKRGASAGLRMKVSEKGAVSIYGMGRFPVTLYKEQWLKLLAMSDEIRAFIAANEAQLKARIEWIASIAEISGTVVQPRALSNVQRATRWNSVEKVCMRRAPVGVISMVSANTQPVLP
jgi:hypothetical protein